MKVKIKATGEIANIADYSTVRLDKCDSYGVPIDYTFDEVEFINEPTENENGISSPNMPSEQRMRYELTKAAMQSILMRDFYKRHPIPIVELSGEAIKIADEIIKQLKET
jgi:hypothetical protein